MTLLYDDDVINIFQSIRFVEGVQYFCYISIHLIVYCVKKKPNVESVAHVTFDVLIVSFIHIKIGVNYWTTRRGITTYVGFGSERSVAVAVKM